MSAAVAPPAARGVDRFTLTIPSDTAAGMAAQERILAKLESLGYEGRDLFGWRLSLEEALMNAIKHGNRLSEEKTVKVTCELSSEVSSVVVRDEGEGFDPEDVPDCTDEENLERPGGRGIMLMRNFMTRVAYADRGRQLTLVQERSTD